MNAKFNYDDYLNSLNFLYQIVIETDEEFLISTMAQAIERSLTYINSKLSIANNTIFCLQEFRVLRDFQKFSFEDKNTIIKILEKLD